MRLRGYHYTKPGAYFLTICSYEKECIFGGIVNGEMRLSEAGVIVLSAWKDLTNHYFHVQLDNFVIMPNHIHGIVILTDTTRYQISENAAVSHNIPVGAGSEPAPTRVTRRHTLSEIVRSFKTFSARRINFLRQTPAIPVWQRNFYDRVVRNKHELHRIRNYIEMNPTNWPQDEENPANHKTQ